jgi:hypothetical protein
MADLALSDSLIDEYLKYKFQDSYNPNIIRKLFKYIQPFSLKDDNIWMNDPSIPTQLESDPLIEIIDRCDNEKLVQNTLLKFMLTTERINNINYKVLNINDSHEKLKPRYGAIYQSAFGKSNAIKHIKFLLSDAQWIKIIDGYITNSRQWDSNKTLLVEIIPNINIDLTIVGADKDSHNYVINQTHKDEIKSLIPCLKKINSSTLTQNIHDRYIETDKLKILLSSGLEHLNSTSDKDFTYIVEIKNENTI